MSEPVRGTSELDRWLAAQAEREERSVTLSDALFGGRFARYFGHRLRFFAIRYLLASGLHAAKVLLLARVFSEDAFVGLVLIHGIAAVASTFWWGTLETLRERVRGRYRDAEPHRAPEDVARWVVFGAQLATLLALAVAAWSVALVASDGVTPARLLVAAILLRTALDLPLRALHAGVFAVRRVYRPLPSLLAVELVAVVAVLALWPFAGAWAFAPAELLAGVTLAVISLRYTRRTYRLLGMDPLRAVRLRVVRHPAPGRVRASLVAGAATAAMALQSLSVIALVADAPPGLDGRAALLLVVLAPTFQAAFEWTQLLYFDLKRLDERLLDTLRVAFERRVLMLALAMAAIFGGVAAAASLVVLALPSAPLVAALVLFLAATAVLAAEQMRAFARRAYGAVALPALLVVGTVVAVAASSVNGTPVRLLLLAATSLGVALGTRLLAGSADPVTESGRVLPVAAWISGLRRAQGAVEIGTATLAPLDGARRRGRDARDTERWRAGRLAAAVARQLASADARVTWLGPNRLAWFVPVGGRARREGVTLEWLLARSGGRVTSLRSWGTQPTGDVAAAVLAEAALIRGAARGAESASAISALVTTSAASVGAELRATFARLFPDGLVLDPSDRRSDAYRRLAAHERRSILAAAVRGARRDTPDRRRAPVDVTAWTVDGVLRLVFVVPATDDRRRRARWRALVRDASVRSALARHRSPA